MPKVSEISRKQDEVVTARPDEPIVSVAKTMKESNVGSVVVVDDGEPVGIVTDRDLAVRVIAEERDRDVTAEDVMTPELHTVDVDEEISEVIRELGDGGVRRIPIVEDGKIAGIITLDDIVVLLSVELNGISGELGSVTEVIRSHSPPY
ncbi:MAG: CBS domain-containing protein [Halobacteriota archaeon]